MREHVGCVRHKICMVEASKKGDVDMFTQCLAQAQRLLKIWDENSVRLVCRDLNLCWWMLPVKEFDNCSGEEHADASSGVKDMHVWL